MKVLKKNIECVLLSHALTAERICMKVHEIIIPFLFLFFFYYTFRAINECIFGLWSLTRQIADKINSMRVVYATNFVM